MHEYLRAWREHRKLSQEHVASILGKRHTTVGRWESGKMKLSTADLQALADIYKATVGQLMHPPEIAEHIRLLEEFQDIIENADQEKVRAWMALGKTLLK